MASKIFNRRAWSKQEDEMLVSIINEFSTQNQADLNWKMISERLNAKICLSTGFKRQSKQCRERWNNCLKPGLKQNHHWTLKQRTELFNSYRKHGQKWCKIAENLPGRSDNGVKNYFYSSVRKLLRKIDKYITIYNRKIKAQKYLLAKQNKNKPTDSSKKQNNQEDLKLLKTVTREAINKLLLLAEEKHIYKIQVTDDLQCQLIWKVRNSFIQLLQKNQIDEAEKMKEKQSKGLINEDQQQEEDSSHKEQQEQPNQHYSVQAKIQAQKDGQFSENKMDIFNIERLKQFIGNLQLISARTKKKKHRGYNLGTLSEKQIQQAIKAKKKQTLDNEKIIRKQFQEQQKDIIPSSKTVRAIGKNNMNNLDYQASNIDWDNYDSRNGFQESVRSKHKRRILSESEGSQTLKKHKKQQKRRAKEEIQKQKIVIKDQVKLQNEFLEQNLHQVQKNPDTIFMAPKMNNFQLFQQQSNRYYFPNSTIEVNSSSIMSNSHNSIHVNSLNNQYPETPAFGDQNFSFSNNMKNFGISISPENRPYNNFQNFLNTVPIIKITKQEREEPSNSNKNSEKNSQHEQCYGNGLGLFQSFNSFQNPNSHSCEIFDNSSSRNQKASNSLFKSLEYGQNFPFKSSFLNSIPKTAQLEINQNQLRALNDQFQSDLLTVRRSSQIQQFKPEQGIQRHKENNNAKQLPFLNNSGYFQINVTPGNQLQFSHHYPQQIMSSIFNPVNMNYFNNFIPSRNQQNILTHSAEYSNHLPFRFVNESSRLQQIQKSNNLVQSSSLELKSYQQLLFSSQNIGPEKVHGEIQHSFNSSEKKSNQVQKMNL